MGERFTLAREGCELAGGRWPGNGPPHTSLDLIADVRASQGDPAGFRAAGIAVTVVEPVRRSETSPARPVRVPLRET